jgi:hypothetical protein
MASSVVLLLVLSWSKTKLFWYVNPAIPLFSLATAIGASDAVQYFSKRDPVRARRVAVGIAILCLAAGASTVWHAWTSYANDKWTLMLRSQARDGLFLSHLHAAGFAAPVIVVDDRFFKGAEFSGAPSGRYYNQVVDFYAGFYRGQWRIDQLAPDGTLRPASMALTCSPAALAWITGRYSLAIVSSRDGCVLGRVVAERPASVPGARAPYRPAIGMGWRR